ncbi:MAG: DUF192 domain-containing protein [Fimbriimonadaceae bacterium]
MPRYLTMNTLILLIALAGCGKAPDVTASQSSREALTTSERQAQQSSSQIGIQDNGSGAQTTGGQATGGQEQPKDQHRKIEYRRFQLDDLDIAEVKFEETVIKMWVMDTDAKRAEGMMFVQDGDFKPEEGMIFVFKVAQPLSFWMRNTLVPLDIAYCDAKGVVLNTYTMRALDETSDYSSRGNAMYAIELKAGLIKKLKIHAGDKFEIPETVVAKN